MPKIIILIRDPRISLKNDTTINYYSNLIKEFELSINKNIEKYEHRLMQLLENKLNQYTSENENGANIARNAFKWLRAEKVSNEFKVEKYYTIYYRASFDNDEEHKYYELIKVHDKYIFSNTNFLELSRFLNESSIAENPLNINPSATTNIQKMIDMDNKTLKTRQILVENIFIECQNNFFSHFRDIEGFLRFLEQYLNIFPEIEKINKLIPKNIPNETIRLENCSFGITLRHELDKIIYANITDAVLQKQINLYIKYLYVYNYSEIFSIEPD